MPANRTRAFTVMMATTVLQFLVVGSALSDDGDQGPRVDRRIKVGFDIADQQGIALDHNIPALGLGSYLVTALGCNDCHTWPNYAANGNPYNRQTEQVNIANYLAGGRLFAFPTENVCSRNLTPAPGKDLPAGLTRGEFKYVIRTGCDPQDANFNDPQSCGLLQVMPWPALRATLRQNELDAIYDYLSAIPTADPTAPPAGQCTPDPQGVAGK